MILAISFLFTLASPIQPFPKNENFKCDAYKLGIHYLQNAIKVGAIWISGPFSKWKLPY